MKAALFDLVFVYYNSYNPYNSYNSYNSYNLYNSYNWFQLLVGLSPLHDGGSIPHPSSSANGNIFMGRHTIEALASPLHAGVGRLRGCAELRLLLWLQDGVIYACVVALAAVYCISPLLLFCPWLNSKTLLYRNCHFYTTYLLCSAIGRVFVEPVRADWLTGPFEHSGICYSCLPFFLI